MNRTKRKQTKLAMQQIVTAVNRCQEICRKLPENLNALVDIKSCPEAKEPFMKKIPPDGWGQELYDNINGTPVIKTIYMDKEYLSTEIN